ncbi:MAG TPA: hypothetical protein VD963_11270 [Phycisphaerales bacterium]|nr:hypothetical protein [Phycisphaerales bacterium]
MKKSVMAMCAAAAAVGLAGLCGCEETANETTPPPPPPPATNTNPNATTPPATTPDRTTPPAPGTTQGPG